MKQTLPARHAKNVYNATRRICNFIRTRAAGPLSVLITCFKDTPVKCGFLEGTLSCKGQTLEQKKRGSEGDKRLEQTLCTFTP